MLQSECLSAKRVRTLHIPEMQVTVREVPDGIGAKVHLTDAIAQLNRLFTEREGCCAIALLHMQ